MSMVREEVMRSGLVAKLGAALMTSALRRLKRRTDYAEHGGAPLLGVDGVALICHGGSNATALKNAVYVANRFAQIGLGHELRRPSRNTPSSGTLRRRPPRGGALVIAVAHHRDGARRAAQETDQRRLAKMVDTSTAGSSNAPGSASDTFWSRRSPRAISRPRRRRRRAARPASIRPAVDCIIVGTVTGDCPFPATATFVQKKLGAKNGGCAFDLSAACAGFLYGVSIADSFIRTGQFKNVLVIGVEVLSRIVDWTDRATCVLFGDGAGAVLMTADQAGVPRPPVHAPLRRRRLTDILLQPAGGSREALTPAGMAEKRHLVKMNGREVYKHAVRNMAAASKTALEANRLTSDDVSWVIAHQANIRIIEGVAERVGIPLDRFYINVDRYGNTSSASVPTALDEAVELGKLKDGDMLLFSALGGGLAWASAAVRW
jgi:3-oxoacyl-[acyl-carrier-protein] synthase-3